MTMQNLTLTERLKSTVVKMVSVAKTSTKKFEKAERLFLFLTRGEHLFTVRVEATPNFSELKR